MRLFLIKLFIFSLSILLIDYYWNQTMPQEYKIPQIWFILGFFVALTLAFHLFSIRFSDGNPQQFIRFYMGSTALRMLLCISAIVAYRFIDKSTVIPFAMGFLVHYFLFTIFEVSSLLKQLKQ